MSKTFPNQLIPFYGGKNPRLFEIERRCMDRDGHVVTFLDRHLPNGLVLDVGAGNGFTAMKLRSSQRTVIPMEPDENMVDHSLPLAWAWGVAQSIPFHNDVFDAAYATWAFFFQGIKTFDDGLREIMRVVKPGGLIAIIDNAGDDELCALTTRNIASNMTFWESLGFTTTVINTAYKFDSLEEANELLRFYFGDDLRNDKIELAYRVAAYTLRV